MKTKNINDRRKFKLYLFTTEVLKDYMYNLNIKDQHVLTVAASGDQALNSVFLGAKSVDMFDFSKDAYYYSFFKIFALQHLDFDKFFKLIVENNKSILDYPEIYEELRKSLPPDLKEFWDQKYHLKDEDEIFNLTRDIFFRQDPRWNYYLENEENYILTQAKIKNIEITYHQSNLLNLPSKLKIKNHYGTIMLSNIHDYLPMKAKYYQRFLTKSIVPMLEENGTLQYGYYFDGEHNTSKKYSLENTLYYLAQDKYNEDNKDLVKIYVKK